MTMLYNIEISRHVPSLGTPVVHAIPTPGMVGDLNRETGELVIPDPEAVREALPYRWRKAFDRSGGRFWHDNAGNAAAHLSLKDRKGFHLVTLRAVPYYRD